MKAYICIEVTDDSIKSANMTYEDILDASLGVLSDLYREKNLVFDCGYNPQIVTDCVN